MSYKNDNLIANPSAAPGFGMTGWKSFGVSPMYGGSDDASHFKMSRNGYMIQEIPSSRLNGLTPIDFLFEMNYWLDYEPEHADVRTDAILELVYQDGSIDTFVYPLFGEKQRWIQVQDIIQVSDKKDLFLDKLILTVSSRDSNVGLRLDNFRLFANEESKNAQSSNERFKDFSDKSILYGLESEMPVLR